MKKETSEEKKTLGEWLNEHPKSVFLTRAFAWAVFAAGLPFSFIAWRYGIFKPEGSMAISGWGVIGIVILGVFFISLFRYIKQGMQMGIVKQCIIGFCKIIIPLLIVLLVVHEIKSNVDLFEKALIVTITCEMIAIPINPFPVWLEQRRIEKNLTEQESVFGVLWDKFFTKKKETENGKQ